jgi:L-amino acid N-acyltransferase YncA
MLKNISLEIRPMLPGDWPAVRTIFQEGIDTGNATFEEKPPDWEEWDSSHLRDCRLVAVLEGQVVAWASLTPVSGRCVYAGVAEVSIYIAAAVRGKGIGGELMETLIKESEEKGYWTLQAGIFPENEVSMALHQKYGFRIVGVRERMGKMDECWRDVMLLERRSPVVGK